MTSSSTKKYYFASDFHFGIPDRLASKEREDLFIAWLKEIKDDAAAIFLMGDLFDFWFEYRTVVPKGYVRLLSALEEMRRAGIAVHLFRGNHDIWAFDYLTEEVGIQLHRKPEIMQLFHTTFYLAHGDGLGPGDHGYKLLRRVFECRLCQWLFRWLHPDLGTRLGLYFSRRSRLANITREGRKDAATRPQDEMLVHYARGIASAYPDVQYFVFGHRHTPFIHPLNDNASVVLLGDWLTHYSYLSFDGDQVRQHYYKPK